MAIAGHSYLSIYPFELSGLKWSEISTIGDRLGSRAHLLVYAKRKEIRREEATELPLHALAKKDAIPSPRACTASQAGCIMNGPHRPPKLEISAFKTLTRFFRITSGTGPVLASL